MTRFVLVRHGESNTTVARTIGGYRTCRGLSPLGRKQAEALADRLARTGEVEADVLVSSSFPRAIETAELIAPALHDLPIVVDPAVGEHDPGPECDGLSFQDFLDRHGMPDWESDPHRRSRSPAARPWPSSTIASAAPSTTSTPPTTARPSSWCATAA